MFDRTWSDRAPTRFSLFKFKLPETPPPRVGLSVCDSSRRSRPGLRLSRPAGVEAVCQRRKIAARSTSVGLLGSSPSTATGSSAATKAVSRVARRRLIERRARSGFAVNFVRHGRHRTAGRGQVGCRRRVRQAQLQVPVTCGREMHFGLVEFALAQIACTPPRGGPPSAGAIMAKNPPL